MKKIYIKPEVYTEIMYHVRKSDIEVSGVGRIERTGDGTLCVTKVYLLKQENSAVTTDLDPESMAQLMYETREDKGMLNFWWHSHVNMGTTWSGTDLDTMKEFGKNGFLLSTVFNKRAEMRSAYYQGGSDFFPPCFIDDIETRIEYIPSPQEVEIWEKEHEEKCATKKFKVVRSFGTNKFNKNTKQTNFFDDDPRFKEGLPAHFNEPHFWDDGMGNTSSDIPDADELNHLHYTYSGLNFEGIAEAVEQDVNNSLPFNEVPEDEVYMWWDLYEIMSGNDPSEEKVKRLYNRCIKDVSVFEKVMDRFYKNSEKFNLGTVQ